MFLVAIVFGPILVAVLSVIIHSAYTSFINSEFVMDCKLDRMGIRRDEYDYYVQALDYKYFFRQQIVIKEGDRKIDTFNPETMVPNNIGDIYALSRYQEHNLKAAYNEFFIQNVFEKEFLDENDNRNKS